MFKSKQKLIVSGCSYTDNAYEFPVWPTLLGEKLNMESVNLARRGQGNEFIYGTLLDYIIGAKNIGLVIAMWSEFHRIDFQFGMEHPDEHLSNGWVSIHTIRKNYPDNSLGLSWKDNIADELKKHRCNEPIYRTRKSLRYFYSFQKILEALNINYLQITGTIPDWGDSAYLDCKEILSSDYTNLINEKTFIGWPLFDKIGGFTIDNFLNEKDPTDTLNRIDGRRNSAGSMIDCHPNKLGHEQIADFIYEYYVENIK